MTSRKIILLAVFALGLMFLFLALFGSKSYFQAQRMLEKNIELESKIQDVSYSNARLGSTKDRTSENTVVLDGSDGAVEETGFELFSSLSNAYKVFIVIAFTLAGMFFIVALIGTKSYRKAKEEFEEREEKRKANGEDDIFDNRVVDMRTKDGFNKVCDTIAVGGVAIIPTDTVYGFCAIADENSKTRLERIKERDPNKNFIVLSTLTRAKHLFGKNLANDIYSLWPSPLTVIALRADKNGTVAVRVPDDKTLERMLSVTGSVYSTSVNISGEPELNDIKEIKSKFGSKVDIIGYDPDKKFTEPSTILDASVFPFKIVRQGAFSREELEAHLQLQ